ncbi:MAG: diguanylate cyclase, partial [Deltaproteobacteria bacterium]|nr:diguanylate cyclase [Deltaproteobacteria bacterium]
MADKTAKEVRFLAEEIIVALGEVLQKRKPLDADALSESLLERPNVMSLLETVAVEQTDIGSDFSKKERELNDLSKKHDQVVEDLKLAELEAQDMEEALKRLAYTLATLAENHEEPALDQELENIKEALKLRAVPSRILAITQELKNFLLRLDTGAVSAESLQQAFETPLAEDFEENVRDILNALLETITSYEEPHLQEQTRALSRKISVEFTLDNFEPYVQEIVDLIYQLKEAVRVERQRLFRFSQEVMVHLEETERDLFKTIDLSRERFENFESDFENRVSEDIEEIENSFNVEGIDLDQVRNTVLDRISAIRQRFREKRAQDQARILEAESERGAIKRRLASVHKRYEEFSKRSKTMLQEMEKFKKASLHDSLTKVYNRRGYDAQIKKAVEDYQKGELAGFSMIVFDVDLFRTFNNNYGHRAGDKILAHVARMGQEKVRQDDFLARYGGDEFVIILPEVNLKIAQEVAEKIRKGISEVEFKLFRDRDVTARITL